VTFRIRKSDPSLTAALRRIADAQLDDSLAALEGPGTTPEGIHKARARTKRLRGLLRLVRPGFADFAAENAALRDAARHLARLRAQGAGLETLDRLAARAGDGIDEAALAEIRAVFAADAVPALAADPAADVAAARAALSACRARAAAWSLSGAGFEPLRKGLTKTYARACKELRAAQQARTPDAFHEWRKSVKYHWYHAQLLRPIKPGKIKPRIARAKELGELLGAHHDLVDLQAHLAAPTLPEAPARALAAPVRREMARIEEEALSCAPALFSDTPSALGDRFERWWHDW